MRDFERSIIACEHRYSRIRLRNPNLPVISGCTGQPEAQTTKSSTSARLTAIFSQPAATVINPALSLSLSLHTSVNLEVRGMKNLYPKGKGRIHPSPSATAASPRSEALAVLRILPAAILALTAALGNDDKEVLAYLIMRSIGGLEEASEQRRWGKPGELHTRLFGCGCFDCYTSFWSRWDCSPDRELIHQAIEAFEDHLASSERAGASAKGKRRERKVGDLPEKGKKKGKDKEKISDEISALAVAEEGSRRSAEEETAEAFAEEVDKGDREEVFEPAASETVPEVAAAQTLAAGVDRRKGWADVTAIFNSRLWNLWSPGD